MNPIMEILVMLMPTIRQTYLIANGYVDLDANHALGQGLSTITRSG
jgi:hypothetical protein